MKDLLEPFLYPQNLLLYGLLLACLLYRKKGLWLLWGFYYLVGNTYIANHARLWYQQGISSVTPRPAFMWCWVVVVQQRSYPPVPEPGSSNLTQKSHSRGLWRS